MSYLSTNVPEIPATGKPDSAAQDLPIEVFAYCIAETKSLAFDRFSLLNPDPSTISKLAVSIPAAIKVCVVTLAPPEYE